MRYIVSLSGGKDSTAAALFMWYESGIPRCDLQFVFCDTGNEDALTYSFISHCLPFPVQRLEPDHKFYDLVEQRGWFPTPGRRYCTRDLKITPFRRYIKALKKENPDEIFINVLGLRREEGRSRSNIDDLIRRDYDLDIYRYCPLAHASLADVWALHRKYLDSQAVADIIADDQCLLEQQKALLLQRLASHAPCNPLYLMGSTRVGCFPCIFSRSVREIEEFRAARLGYIQDLEQRYGCRFFAPGRGENEENLEISCSSGMCE